MKTILTLIIALLFSITGFSQTELIAYKSHSGNMAYFKTDGADNLGGPPIMIDSIVKLNDSTIIEYNSYGWGYNNKGPVYTDTVVNHPICKIPNVPLDSLKGLYYRSDIIFIGFDSTKIDEQKKDSVIEKINKEVEVQEEEGSIVLPTLDNNEITPITNDSVNTVPPTKNVLLYFIIVLLGFMIVFTAIVWLRLKKRIAVS